MAMTAMGIMLKSKISAALARHFGNDGVPCSIPDKPEHFFLSHGFYGMRPERHEAGTGGSAHGWIDNAVEALCSNHIGEAVPTQK